MKNCILALAFLSLPAMADLVLDIRDDDPGFMTFVSPEDVLIEKSIDFNGLSAWDRAKDGFTWHAVLQGMITECRTTQNNPCQWPNTQSCIENGGMKPVNRSGGTPVSPLLAVITETQAHTFQYQSNFGEKPLISYSRGGCEHLGGSDWGDGPWALVLDAPREAICFEVGWHSPEIVRRQHFKFWRDNGGEIEKVGHHDLVGEPGIAHQTVCWQSSVPFNAVSTWQDGPGIGWLKVSVGVSRELTACELAMREAEQICAAGAL